MRISANFEERMELGALASKACDESFDNSAEHPQSVRRDLILEARSLRVSENYGRARAATNLRPFINDDRLDESRVVRGKARTSHCTLSVLTSAFHQGVK